MLGSVAPEENSYVEFMDNRINNPAAQSLEINSNLVNSLSNPLTEIGARQREVAASYQAKDGNFNPAIEGGKNRSRMQ